MECTDYIPPLAKTATVDEGALREGVWFEVTGMGCVNCATRVQNSLLVLRGVISAYADFRRRSVLVIFNPTMVEVNDLIDAIEGAAADDGHRYKVYTLFSL